jgi:threonylcarbamoyladenosine tRNA methylthiotransferase MtaB
MFSSILERDNRVKSNAGVVPENVRVKRSKMMRGLSVKRRFFYETSWEAREQFFESENKEVTRFYRKLCKSKTPWNPD